MTDESLAVEQPYEIVSVRKMSVEEADECAHKMIDLYRDIVQYRDNGQEPLPLGDQPAVSPFLVHSG